MGMLMAGRRCSSVRRSEGREGSFRVDHYEGGVSMVVKLMMLVINDY